MLLQFQKRLWLLAFFYFVSFVLGTLVLRTLSTEKLLLSEDWGYVAVFGFVFVLSQALYHFNRKALFFFVLLSTTYMLGAFIKRFAGMILSEREIVHSLCFSTFACGLLLTFQCALNSFKKRRLKQILKILLAFLSGIFMLLGFVMVGYFIVNNAVFSDEILLTLFQTNAGEVLAYLSDQNLWLWGILIALMLALAAAFCVFFYHMDSKENINKILLFAAFLFLMWVGLKIIPKTNVHFSFNIAYNTFETLKNFQAYHKNKDLRFKKMHELMANGLQSSQKGLYVLVVGESATRDHMSAYGYNRQTTPWLDQLKNNANTIIFSNAYSNHTHTVPTLSYALSSLNQYQNIEFDEAYSIIEVAKAAGFETYWISNQPKDSVFLTPISVISSTADKQIWLNSNTGDKISASYYDEKVVEALQNLKTNDKILVVVHLMGSHGAYRDRYPQKFNLFKKGASKHVDAYDNSILYTDYVLQKIDETMQQNPYFMALIYLSDHGDDADNKLGHESSRFSYPMARIPFLIKVSDRFISQNKMIFNQLIQNQKAVFTNDLLYNFLCSLLKIEGLPQYNESLDLTSSKYQLTKQKALTLHGQKSLASE